MLSRFFNRHHPFLSLSIIVLVTVLPLALFGCGGKTVDVATSHDHPANPNAPQAAFEQPADVLTEELVHAQNAEHADGMHSGLRRHSGVALSPAASEALMKMLHTYFAIGNQLAADTMADVGTHAYAMLEAFHTLEHEVSTALWEAHAGHTEAIHDTGHELADLSKIKAARVAYGSLSDALNHFVSAVGVPASDSKPVVSYVCGMASDVPHGGLWLQIGDDVRNPYFGSAMLKCHSEKAQLPIAGVEISGHEHMMKEEGEHGHSHEHEAHDADKGEHKHEKAGADQSEQHKNR